MTLLILLAVAFLLLLGALAVAAVRFASPRDAEGRRSAPGCLAGCAVALVLSLLGLAGLAVFTGAAALVAAPTEEFRDDLREAAHDVGDGLRELGQELRENSEEVRRELREELDNARRARRERERERALERERADESGTLSARPDEPDSSADSGSPSSAPWRARVVVSWPGESDPSPELLAALTSAALAPPVELSVQTVVDETDGERTIATLSAQARAASVKALDALLRADLARESERSGVEYALESVVDDVLR